MDRAAAQRFLTGCEVAKAALPRAVESFGPFFDIVSAGAYAPAPTNSLDLTAMNEAISRAGALPVAGIVPVSLAEAARRAAARQHGAFRRELGIVMRGGLWLRMWTVLGPSLDAGLGGWEGRRSVQDAFDRGLGFDLRAVVDARLSSGFDADHRLHLWNTMAETLFYYLGFAVCGDEACMNRLEPLVRLLPYALPICERPGSPGIWLVLVE